MIRWCESVPALSDPLMACRFSTLYACYGAERNPVDCYQSDLGGALCRFGRTLLLSGKTDPQELSEFCSLLGIDRLEGRGFDIPTGWNGKAFPVLMRPPFSANDPLPDSIEHRRIFSILCESDGTFAEEADYLEWLSDLTLRARHGHAACYLLEDCATASIVAQDSHCALLALVAVRPDMQGKHYGKRLLGALSSNRTLYTVAANESLLPFYQGCGFVPQREPMQIAVR